MKDYALADVNVSASNIPAGYTVIEDTLVGRSHISQAAYALCHIGGSCGITVQLGTGAAVGDQVGIRCHVYTGENTQPGSVAGDLEVWGTVTAVNSYSGFERITLTIAGYVYKPALTGEVKPQPILMNNITVPCNGYTAIDVSVTDNLDAMLEDVLTSLESSAGDIRAYGCYSARGLLYAVLDSAYSIGDYAFALCTDLREVVAPALVEIFPRAFSDCVLLSVFDAPSVLYIEESAFYGCEALTSMEFNAPIKIEPRAFMGCSSLSSLSITGGSQVCELDDVNAFSGTPIASGNGYIYVPYSLVDDYKAATNWSTFASQIMPY